MKRAHGGKSAVASVGVLVLGMHRSGTSVVTNLLAELGCDLGGPTIEGQPDNPRGYWEHCDVTGIHEELLRATGRAWSDPWPIADDDFRGAAAELARGRLEEVLRRDMLPHPLWVVKDPRLCRLTRLWQDLVDSLGFEVRVAHTVRAPSAVAQSLLARDGIPPWKSHLLWLRHYLEAELFSRRFPRTVVQMEDLERRPEAELGRLCGALGLTEHLAMGRAQEVAERVFARELVHHHADDREAEQGFVLHPWVARAYACLQDLGGDGEAAARAELDGLRQKLEQADRLVAPDRRSFELELDTERTTRLTKTLEHYDQTVTVQRREVDAARQEVAVLREYARAQVEEWMALRAELGRLRDRLSDSSSAAPRVGAAPLGAGATPARGTRDGAPVPSLQLDAVVAELATVRGLVEAVCGELRGGFAGLDQRHVEVLGRSIDFAARLEERWAALEVELGQARAELEQVSRALERVTAGRAQAVVERDQAVVGRDQALARSVALLAELESLRVAHATVVEEGRRLAHDFHQTISTRSWRYTAQVRRLWGLVLAATRSGAR